VNVSDAEFFDAWILRTILDGLVAPIAIVDSHGRIVFANRAMSVFLSHRSGDLPALPKSVRTIAKLQLLSSEFVARIQRIGHHSELTLITIAGFIGRGHDLEIALRELFTLTNREARLARELYDGFSLAESAGRLNIQLSTARTHLKRIFDKTSSRRQSQLVRLITIVAISVCPGELKQKKISVSPPVGGRIASTKRLF
jgi:DNA-binding CsgD family transcriptional regulator